MEKFILKRKKKNDKPNYGMQIENVRRQCQKAMQLSTITLRCSSSMHPSGLVSLQRKVVSAGRQKAAICSTYVANLVRRGITLFFQKSIYDTLSVTLIGLQASSGETRCG